MKKRVQVFFAALVAMVYGSVASATGLLGIDGATLFGGASDDVKSMGNAVLGVAILIAVFGFVFALVHRK
jgi:hypothetical protein